jgi:AcrR family transcriptional regulator
MTRRDVGRVTGKPPGQYHHGTLGQSLIEATLVLIRERGPAAFTMKDAATAAGVSVAAPYRHFPDREHLLAAAAVPGYADLLSRLRAVREDDAPAGLARLMATFVQWALDDPATHDILFASSLDKSAHQALVDIGAAAVELFTEPALAAAREQMAAARLMVSAFAIAQGHAGIADEHHALAAGQITRADLAPMTYAAVLALAQGVSERGPREADDQ